MVRGVLVAVGARARVREGRSDDEDWTMKGFKARLVFGADFWASRAMGLLATWSNGFIFSKIQLKT